jgi:hypothetical protein
MRGIDDFDDYEDYEDTEEIPSWRIDKHPELWQHDYMSEDHPICPFDLGDSNNLCIKDIYGCHFIWCEFADD